MALNSIFETAASQLWQEGRTILPGITKSVYFIRRMDIVAWPVFKFGRFEGSFTLAEGKKWKQLDVKVDKSPVSCEAQGEIPSKTYLSKATFVHPLAEEEAAEFAQRANNDIYIYIIQTKNRKFRIIGHEFFDTDTRVSTALGAAVTDESGTTVEVQCTTEAPAPFYSGSIITDSGDVNPPPASE